MAFADNTIKAFQDAYDNAIYPALGESSVFALPLSICRLQQTNAAKTVKFYNMNSASASDGTTRLQGLDNTHEGTAGDIVDYTATIKQYYADRKVYRDELDSTSLDIASDFIQSFVRAVDRKINLEFLGAIDTAKSGHLIGDITKGPEEQIEEYIYACELAFIKAVSAPDYADRVILVMNSKDYATLYKADKKTSADYAHNTNLAVFYGATVKTFEADTVASGKAYVIPWGVVGFAYWSEVDASSSYQDLFDGLYLWAKKSGGSVVIEADAISVIQSKPIA